MRKFALSALAVSALIGAACTPVSAQAPAAGDAARPAQTARPAQAERMRGHLPGERIDARLAYVKTALKITPQQEPQWNAFADVLRRHAQAMDQQVQQQRQAREQSRTQTTSAIDRLQERQKMMADGAARMNEVIVAARPLYASFNDEQKKTADEMLNRRRGGFGHHHSRWH
jgi:hypothetical protein